MQTSILRISLSLSLFCVHLETLYYSVERLGEAGMTKIKLFQVSDSQSVFRDRISQNVELSGKIPRILLMMCATGV